MHGSAFMKVFSQWRRPTGSQVIATQDNVCHNPSVYSFWEVCKVAINSESEPLEVLARVLKHD